MCSSTCLGKGRRSTSLHEVTTIQVMRQGEECIQAYVIQALKHNILLMSALCSASVEGYGLQMAL